VVVGLSGWSASALIRFVSNGYEVTGPAAVNALVDRIIGVESNNRFDATNKASSASGVGQFIEGTWLDLIRVYRPELARIGTKTETLELRREPKIAREMTARFVERNAALLKRRGLPVTASTVYLAHFAGGAGAVAILSADENADAAWVMAKADAKGRITRDQIIKANPFLQHFSVSDLKRIERCRVLISILSNWLMAPLTIRDLVSEVARLQRRQLPRFTRLASKNSGAYARYRRVSVEVGDV
jgi:hypothetical protein